MKKQNMYAALAAAVVLTVAFAVIVQSCKKSNLTNEEQKGENLLKSDYQMTEREQNYYDKMVWFDSIMQLYYDNQDYHSDETLSPDEAIWYLEAYYNAKYSHPDKSFDKMNRTTGELTIPKTQNNEVLYDDLFNTLQDINTKVSQFYTGTTYTKKALLLVNLEETNETTVDNMAVSISISVGQLINAPDTWSDPFLPGDDWKYGDDMGKCFDPVYESGAADQLEDSLIARKTLIEPPQGYVVRYTDYTNIEFNGNKYIGTDGSYLCFYIADTDGDGFTDEEICLRYWEMNDHYYGEKEVIYNKVPNDPGYDMPDPWAFFDCDISGLTGTNNNGVDFISHYNNLIYAEYYFIREPYPISVNNYLID